MKTPKPTARTILITGATGFIGSALTPALRARGDRVLAFSRNAKQARRTLGDDVEIVDSLAHIDRSRAIDAVVNLAGAPLASGPWTARRKQGFIDSRVRTTAALIDLMDRLKTRPEVLVSGSAVGYYGDRGEETLDEHSDAAPGFLSELCQLWETEAQRAIDLGVRTCLLRTGLVMGSSGGMLPPLLLSTKLGCGAVLGDGRQWNPWIHIEDEVGLILHLLDHPTLSGPFNAVAPAPVRQVDLMRLLAKALHRPQWLRVPQGLLKLAGEMSDLFLVSERALPVFALESGYVFAYPELGPALAAIVRKRR